MSIFLRQGTIVTSSQQFVGDLLIRDGVIAAFGLNLEKPSDVDEIDCKGMLVMPGGIDPHTHIEMPGQGSRVADDWYTATRAAAAGGTTCVIDFVPVAKGENPVETLEHWEEVAKKSVIDYSFHMTAVEWNDQVRQSLKTAVEHGINSVKVYLAYKNVLMLESANQFLELFTYAKDLGMLPQVHCEDGETVVYMQKKIYNSGEHGPSGHPKSRPAFVEATAVASAIDYATAADSPVYIVHNTCAQALNVIKSSSENKLPIFAECTITHLIYNDSRNSHPDFDVAAGVVLSPPLRSELDRLALWEGIRTGLVKTLCTDHCPWTLAQKRRGTEDFRRIANGVPAIEERMVLAFSYGVSSGMISPMEFVTLTSTNAAKIFNMYPKKGEIAIGSDGDIVIFDPHAKRTIALKDQKGAADYNIFEGIEVTGIPICTISKGKVIWSCAVTNGVAQYKDGKLTEERSGQFIPRKPFAPIVYGRTLK